MRIFILIITCCIASVASATTWQCQHEDHDRENLTFTPQSNDTVMWKHEKLGVLEPLKLIVNSDNMLTMATQQVNIIYSRFFHLDKFSGRMGETTFRGSVLRRLSEKDPDLNWALITTIWSCEEVIQDPK